MNYEVQIIALESQIDELAEEFKKVLGERGLFDRVFVSRRSFIADGSGHTLEPNIDVFVKRDKGKNFSTNYFQYSRADYYVKSVIDRIEEIDKELES